MTYNENECKMCDKLNGQFGDIKKKKCILHCEKDDWYEYKVFIEDNKPEKKRLCIHSVKEFWQTIREFINEQKSEILFESIIFPNFEQMNPMDLSIADKSEDGTNLYRIKKDTNFWNANKLLVFDRSITFMNCTFLGKADFSHIIFKNAVNIRNSHFTNNIQINESQFKDQLYFCEGTRINELRINYSTKINKLKFENISFLSDVLIKSSEIEKLEIINNTKIKNITILNNHINSIDISRNDEFNKLEIHNTTFHEEFKYVGYNKITLVKKTIFNETYFSINPNGKSKPDFKFIETTFNKEMYFSIIDLPIKNLEFVYCTLNNRMKLSSKGNWYDESNHFQNSSLDNLRIFHCDLKPYSELFVNLKSIAIIKIEEVMYSGNIIIKDLLKNKEFIIRESNVANTNLSNCNLEKSKITILDSLLFSGNAYLTLNGIKWSSTDSMYCDRDTFRQLKYANEQQGNIIEANKFYSAEMEAYKKEIKEDTSSESAKDKFVFGINYLISDFSRDWILPLIWYFIFGFLFSYCYYFDISIINNQGIVSSLFVVMSVLFFVHDFKKYNSFRKTLYILFITSGLNYFMNITQKSLEKLFLFINPLNTSGLEDNDARLIWWILFRIISVFIIYQFIISLRRQTRR